MQEVQHARPNIRTEDGPCKDEQQEDGGKGGESSDCPVVSSLIPYLVPD